MFFSKKESEEKIVKRLCNDAGHIIEMLKHVFTTDKGLDIRKALIFSSSLAGYACHQAVIGEKKSFVIVETKDKKKFYFGDDVNKYLLENKNSVIGLCNAIVNLSNEDILKMVSDFAKNVGNEDMTLCGLEPQNIFNEVKQCWDGIYENMTSKYCKSPSEYPILFGIVLQNMLIIALKAGAPKDEAGKIAMECAIAVSKMDTDSF